MTQMRGQSICGAHAPSSPLPAAIPLFLRRSLTVLWTAALAKTASSASAAPPRDHQELLDLGRVCRVRPAADNVPERERHLAYRRPEGIPEERGSPSAEAAAFAFARERATATFDPILGKFRVPSISRSWSSKLSWSDASIPMSRDQVLDGMVDCLPRGRTFASAAPVLAPLRGGRTAKPACGRDLPRPSRSRL